MAVSSQSKSTTSSSNSVPGAPKRISFAKLREPLEVPGLLDVQIDSFDWLIGAPRWREIAKARGDIDPTSGLEEVLDDPAKNIRAYLDAKVGELEALSDKELRELGEKAKEAKEELEEEERNLR